MKESSRTNIYFVSDFHLGADMNIPSSIREKHVVAWLKSIAKDAQTIYLLGDIFDYWFEYRHVIPKGYTRLFGKISDLIDSGVQIHFVKGNHDMWVYEYFQNEIGIQVHNGPIEITYNQKSFHLVHGDGLGKGDHSYRLIKIILHNRFCQWIFSILHPSWGIPLMKLMSKWSRNKHGESYIESHQRLESYAKQVASTQPIDYFIAGHIHDPVIKILDNCTYVNLGDWVEHFTYGKWDGETFHLGKYPLSKSEDSLSKQS